MTTNVPRPREKPMVTRLSIACAFVVMAASHATAQQRAITEDEAVHAFLTSMPLDTFADAQAEEQHALGLVYGAWPNPEIDYSREDTNGPGGTGEDYVYASQRIDISGRLFQRRDAGDRRASAARLEVDARIATLEAELRSSFHRALAAQRRAEALDDWCTNVEAALAIVDRRAARGDAAPYDALRLRRELRAATLRRDEAHASYEGEVARLAVFVGDDSIVPTGELRPSLDDAALARGRGGELGAAPPLAHGAGERGGDRSRRVLASLDSRVDPRRRLQGRDDLQSRSRGWLHADRRIHAADLRLGPGPRAP